MVPRVTKPVVPRVQPRFDTERTPPPTWANPPVSPRGATPGGSLLSYLPRTFVNQLTPEGLTLLLGTRAFPTTSRSRTRPSGVLLNPAVGEQGAVHEAMHVLDRVSGTANAVGTPTWLQGTAAAVNLYTGSPWYSSLSNMVTAAQFAVSPNLRRNEVLATSAQRMSAAGLQMGSLAGMGYSPSQLAGLSRYFTRTSLGIAGGQ